MALLPLKIFAISTTGLTAVGGTGVVTSKLVTGNYLPWAQSATQETNENTWTIEIPYKTGIPVNSSLTGYLVIDQLVSTHLFNAVEGSKGTEEAAKPVIEPLNIEDQELVEEKEVNYGEVENLKGRLVLSREHRSSDWGDGFKLKMYFDDSTERNSYITSRFDIHKPKREVEEFLHNLNWNDLWADSDNLGDLLEALKGKKSEFSDMFGPEVFQKLESIILKMKGVS
ncbi:hypothetical protein MHLP_02185 [Candidatus Mycoplasma haematolamae str. Purdue]|uniref:Uncharacterized protein n=1 Tax=Mycoplasma haematolamae (strain Purdue) TaxID=1212765 RepID=I7C696_MYCHA|nr:hypothetical protein [Candidatus Mycoplasma haematolamae]AFO52017.1 hypothetical protein MHLP_02185 [Candidatus Mycoplasma haematolamae str. Purdue]